MQNLEHKIQEMQKELSALANRVEDLEIDVQCQVNAMSKKYIEMGEKLEEAVSSRNREIKELKVQITDLKSRIDETYLDIKNSNLKLESIEVGIDDINDKLMKHDDDLIYVKYESPLEEKKKKLEEQEKKKGKVIETVLIAIVSFLVGILVKILFPHLGGI